ncbi:MAG: beta-lactamase family protein [Bacteroides sp.]|nr:beta-lactamase family protein [Bacteroides sp.]
MKRFINPLIFLLLMTQLCGCKNRQADDVCQVSNQLDSLFSELFKADEPGAAVVVVRGDSVVYNKGFGLARMDTLVPINDRTTFNICSVSKQFSAVALCLLAEQGKLSLDDTVSKFFPEFKAEFFSRITLRHLMSHTSGIPDARPRNDKAWKEYTAKYKTAFDNVHDFKRFAAEDETTRFMLKLDHLDFEPGTQYDYQNPTFQLMLMIVEKATGEQFDKWMHRNIFLPAGMEQTCYYEPGKNIPNMAHAYVPAEGENKYGYFRSEDGRWEECDYGEATFFGTKADGGIYTTPLEFLKWDKALYSDKVMSQAMRNEAHTPRIATDIPETDYGYGWFIEHRTDRPRKIYHTGDNGGFLIFEGRFPEKDLFYLVFANRPDWNRTETVEKMDQIFATQGWI